MITDKWEAAICLLQDIAAAIATAAFCTAAYGLLCLYA